MCGTEAALIRMRVPLYVTRLQDVYSMTWLVDEAANTITFTVTVVGMQQGFFALGLGTRMIGADIFAFVSFEVRFSICFNKYAGRCTCNRRQHMCLCVV
jgi:hypothetical protein